MPTTGTRPDLAETDDIADSNTERDNNADNIAFCEALERQDIKALKLAITQKHFNVNAIDHKSKTQETALMHVCKKGPYAILESFLNHKDIQVNLQDNKGWTALIFACHYKRIGTATILRDRDDIQANLQDKRGGTVLKYVCWWDELETVATKLLERQDIQTNLKDERGWQALKFACHYRRIETATILLKRDDIQVNHQTHWDRWTVLMCACAHGMELLVMKILERNDIKVNLQDGNGLTALMFACRYEIDKAAKTAMKLL